MDLDSLLQPLDPAPPRTAAGACRASPGPGAWANGVSAYLPLLLMALLALGTWWLVKNTPRAEAPRADAAAAPRARLHDARVLGPALRAPTAGCGSRSRATRCATTPTPTRSRSTARRSAPLRRTAASRWPRHVSALSNGDATEVQLLGDAQVMREGAGDGRKARVRGEFLHAFLNTEHVRSHLPVRLRAGRHDLARRRPSTTTTWRAAPDSARRCARASTFRRDDAGTAAGCAAARHRHEPPRRWSSSPARRAASARRWPRAMPQAGWRLALVARRTDEVEAWARAQEPGARALGRLRGRRARRRQHHRCRPAPASPSRACPTW